MSEMEDVTSDLDHEIARQDAAMALIETKLRAIKELQAENSRIAAAAFSAVSNALSKQAQANEAIGDAMVCLAECITKKETIPK
jgi:hypothetical protein